MGSGTEAVLGLLSTLILTLLGVIGAVRSFIRSARVQREKIVTDKAAEYNRGLGDRQAIYNDGNADARRELTARIDLLTSRLDDANRDRDLAQERADRLEAELRHIWSNPRSSRPRANPNDTQGEGP